MADIQSFFKKDLAGIPVWGWALVIIGGVVVGWYFLKQSGGTSIFSALGTNAGGQAGASEAAGVLAGQSGNGTVPVTFNQPGQPPTTANPFGETTVNGQQVPVLPQGYIPITDASGQVIGYAPAQPPKLITTTTTSPTGGTSHSPGTTFTGPTGVLHYVGNGESIQSLVQKFGLSDWNAFYGIPDNQKVLGKIAPNKVAGTIVPVGAIVTLPPGTKISGGGSERTYVPNVFGAY